MLLPKLHSCQARVVVVHNLANHNLAKTSLGEGNFQALDSEIFHQKQSSSNIPLLLITNSVCETN